MSPRRNASTTAWVLVVTWSFAYARTDAAHRVEHLLELRTRRGAFSRRVVGWSISNTSTAALTTNVLAMATTATQFTSWAFSERVRAAGLLPSMGSRGDLEAFWSRPQVELLDTRRWKTRIEAASAIFEYIEIFHNRRRHHSSLGMQTPIEFELNKIDTQTQAA
jgi:transposase InsO family protein